jgi:hypothetical protein
VILDYLRRQPVNQFGIGDAHVTHVWTQDLAVSEKLCVACHIENVCVDVSEMFGAIDALIIARDDWESHAELAMPFLLSGIPVFVDKPLTLDASELAAFEPYLESGKLMSCSGLRYAVEIDPLRFQEIAVGAIRLITGTVLNSLEKYGIHLIEAVASLGGVLARPVSITRLDAPHDSFVLRLENGTPFHLDCLGSVGKTFHLSMFGDRNHCHFDLHDNFRAFRRTLENFFAMVQSGRPSIDPTETVRIMRLISLARALVPGETAQFEP